MNGHQTGLSRHPIDQNDSFETLNVTLEGLNGHQIELNGRSKDLDHHFKELNNGSKDQNLHFEPLNAPKTQLNDH